LRSATDADLDAWAESGKPLVAVVPEYDDYLQPPAARERFGRVPQADVVAVDGAKHLWVGHTERVLDEVVRVVAPKTPIPLAREWSGPMETADTSMYATRPSG
jgi:pimeloyl-ACP methyl ester carboxylesterase